MTTPQTPDTPQPAPPPQPTLADLIRAITPQSRHDPIDTGAPQGNEIW